MEDYSFHSHGIDKQKQKKNSFINSFRKYYKYLIGFLIICISLSIIAIVSFNSITSPVSKTEAEDINVVIEKGSTINDVAELLEATHLIKNATYFKLYVNMSGQERNMRAGTYKLNPTMSLRQIINDISSGKAMIQTVNVTIKEGSTLKDIAKILNRAGVIVNEKEFLDIAQNHIFAQYPFLDESIIPEARINKQEGYLFPDTYEFYLESEPEKVIKKLLSNFQSKLFDSKGNLKEEYTQRLVYLDMTLDEIIILASIIQKEAREPEFRKVSAVFHNRLSDNQRLESCATINYILERQINTWVITREETRIESPYNTYLYRGLPIGPISSPGEKAIIAAMNPDEEYLNQGFKFFVLKDPETGEHAFSRTYEEAVNNRKKYESNWK